ncbi:MAG: dihydroorotate dehydrogenase electron transfer subunit [Kiritimatiellae bacterium]|nr:dihydroorotate dehydrogenase electron transfer subunit [Kiritimatiellia bacterium]
MHLETAEALDHGPLRGEYSVLSLLAPRIAADVRPGQFVHLRVPRLDDAVLRRPFSVFRAERDVISILYKRVGRGTQAMTAIRAGERLSLIGPLGNGFPEGGPGTFPVLVAGGYGAAPLYLLAQRTAPAGVLFVGGRTRDDVLCVEEFEAAKWPVRVTTEDGSRGRRGLVTDALDAWLAAERPAAEPEFFVCGPDGLLRAVGERAVRSGWRAWLSMDRHMGCGMGACLACVLKIRTSDTAWRWARVCRDGPVFEASRVLWE